MTAPIASTSVTARTCPFVGPRPFRFDERLFGRSREVSRLLNLVIAERIVLIFSPSGAGKTSLIQAGLIPALREEDFFDLPIIRVQQPAPEAAGAFRINRFVRSTLESLERPRPGVDQAPPEHLTSPSELAPAFRQWADTLGPTADGRAPNLVLIFDQFEEILTTDPADVAAKEAFFDQLGSALRDPDLWALFAMREEFVAALEPYLNRIPRRLSSRFRLDLLDADAARQAFEKPFESQGVTVTPDAVNKIVTDLCTGRIQRPDGTTEVVTGPYVEPVHLQIVGLRLWNRYGSDPGFTSLDETHLSGTEGSVDAALAGYYADKVRDISATTDVGERTIREWCERQLITDQGLRGQVLREPGQTRGVPELVIGKLIDAFLVRGEPRRGSTWYELTHDRLIEPIRKNNQEWRQQNLHPLLLRARANDWDRAHWPEGLLLRGPELQDVDSWASTNDRLLTEAERDFIRNSWNEERSEQRIRWNTELTIERGISLCEQGRADDGLLWLMSGLEQVYETKPPDRADHLARFAIAAWQTQITRLRSFQLLDGPVYAVAFSPDGHTALTGSEDKTARLWDVASGLPEGPPLRHDDAVVTVAFSPDGRTVLTGSRDKTARLWDVASAQQQRPALSHDDVVVAVAFSPDGHTALTGSWDKTARLWDVASGLPKGSPLKHDGAVVAVAFSPDGRTALTGSDDRTARLWDVASGNQKARSCTRIIEWLSQTRAGQVIRAMGLPLRISLPWNEIWRSSNNPGKRPKAILKHDDAVNAVAFSPGGDSVLTGCRDWTARLWDVASGQPKGPPLKHEYPVNAVAFSLDGRTALTGSDDRTARLWDVETGQPKGPPLKHDDAVVAVAFSPDGHTALTGSNDRTARLWDIASAQQQRPALRHDDAVFAVAFSPDGRTLMTGSRDTTARLWDVETGKPKGPPLKHDDELEALAFSPDGHTALTGSRDGTGRLWDVKTGQPKGPPLKHDGAVNAVAFSPDGRTLMTGSQDTTARLWDVETGKPKGPPLKHDDAVSDVAFSPDGRTALTGSFDNKARLWDVASAQQEGPALTHDGPVWRVAFSSDGRTVLTGSRDGTGRLWDAATGQQKGVPLKHNGPVWTVAFSPDGRTVLTSSFDATARLWNVQTQKPTGLPLDHGGAIAGAAFSPDGMLVLTSGRDGTVRLWLTKTHRSIGALFSHRDMVETVAFSPDGRLIATASWDGTTRLWRTPTAVEGSLERLALWVRVITRKQLDDSNTVDSIDLEAWRKDRQELDRLGGPPDRPSASGAAVSPAR
jgi:WD40 repeat protein